STNLQCIPPVVRKASTNVLLAPNRNGPISHPMLAGPLKLSNKPPLPLHLGGYEEPPFSSLRGDLPASFPSLREQAAAPVLDVGTPAGTEAGPFPAVFPYSRSSVSSATQEFVHEQGCTGKLRTQKVRAAMQSSKKRGKRPIRRRNEGSFAIGLCSKESNELVTTRIPVIGEGEIHQLNILSEAFFSAATHSWLEEDKNVLVSLLSSLQNILTQPQWEVYLVKLCCNNEFRRSVLTIVKLFEDELNNCRVETAVLHQTGQISYSTLVSLVHLIIPPLLKLLRFLHALWADEVVFHLPQELKEAERMNSCELSLCILGKTLKRGDIDVKENDLGKWLRQIRESGYNLLGLCAPIKGAFSELLDSSSVSEAIVENMRSMQFWHLTRLIDIIIIPFAKHCPHKLLAEWMLKLFLPLISYCEDMLHYRWLDLLNTGRANVPCCFGYTCESEESVKNMENYLLVDLTRKFCKLLGALSSPELNDASCKLNYTSSSSIVGYILLNDNDCFESLSMSLFGWWVDGEATIDAVPFCNALVQVTVDTENGKLRRFVVDDMLPALIRRLCDGLPCMIQQTVSMLSNQMNCNNEKANNDLLVLCRNIYTLCMQSQDFGFKGLDNGNKVYQFDWWFAEQKKDLFVKASSHAPEDFPLPAELYLPIYMDLLHEANAMDDCLEYGSSHQAVFEKLSQDFRIRHAINSCMDHNVRMISNILERKMPAAYWEKRSSQMIEWLRKLITSKPYIKVSDSWESVREHLMANFVIDLKHFRLDVGYAVDFFKLLLFFWEPKFHPLIREDRKDELINTACLLVLSEQSKYNEPLELHVLDFMDHLKPYASSYIYRRKKEFGYFKAREQVKLHEKFDKYLSSGELDDDIKSFSTSEDDYVYLIDKYIANSQFAELDMKLIQVSLKERAQIVKRKHEIDTYSKCLRSTLANEKVKDCLKELISELDMEGFFDVNNNSIIWEKESFRVLVNNFENLVFSVHPFPRHLVIQGIMVVGVELLKWREDVEQFWMDTRYYDSVYYDLLRQPLEKSPMVLHPVRSEGVCFSMDLQRGAGTTYIQTLPAPCRG
ncbi:hypothetical protein U9M48_032089, partial [Paspalum notatum var. saurae]